MPLPGYRRTCIPESFMISMSLKALHGNFSAGQLNTQSLDMDPLFKLFKHQRSLSIVICLKMFVHITVDFVTCVNQKGMTSK